MKAPGKAKTAATKTARVVAASPKARATRSSRASLVVTISCEENWFEQARSEIIAAHSNSPTTPVKVVIPAGHELDARLLQFLIALEKTAGTDSQWLSIQFSSDAAEATVRSLGLALHYA